MKEGSVKRGKLSWLDKRRANQQRIPKIVGILISILFHVFGIWYLLTQLPVEFQSPAQGSMGAVSITLAPAPRSTPKPTVKTPPAKPKTAPAPAKPRRTPPKVAQERMPVTPEAPRTIVTPQPDAPKWRAACQQLVKDHAQRIDVTPGVDVEGAHLGLLGAHVLERADDLSELGEQGPLGQPLVDGLGHRRQVGLLEG